MPDIIGADSNTGRTPSDIVTKIIQPFGWFASFLVMSAVIGYGMFRYQESSQKQYADGMQTANNVLTNTFDKMSAMSTETIKNAQAMLALQTASLQAAKDLQERVRQLELAAREEEQKASLARQMSADAQKEIAAAQATAEKLKLEMRNQGDERAKLLQTQRALLEELARAVMDDESPSSGDREDLRRKAEELLTQVLDPIQILTEWAAKGSPDTLKSLIGFPSRMVTSKLASDSAGFALWLEMVHGTDDSILVGASVQAPDGFVKLCILEVRDGRIVGSQTMQAIRVIMARDLDNWDAEFDHVLALGKEGHFESLREKRPPEGWTLKEILALDGGSDPITKVAGSANSVMSLTIDTFKEAYPREFADAMQEPAFAAAAQMEERAKRFRGDTLVLSASGGTLTPRSREVLSRLFDAAVRDKSQRAAFLNPQHGAEAAAGKWWGHLAAAVLSESAELTADLTVSSDLQNAVAQNASATPSNTGDRMEVRVRNPRQYGRDRLLRATLEDSGNGNWKLTSVVQVTEDLPRMK